VSLQTEVRCPYCDKPEAFYIGEAVIVSRGPKGVKREPVGEVFGCLRCGGNYTVTKTEVFGKKAPIPKPQPNGEAAKPQQKRNPDGDLIMSPDRMP